MYLISTPGACVFGCVESDRLWQAGVCVCVRARDVLHAHKFTQALDNVCKPAIRWLVARITRSQCSKLRHWA